MKRLALLAMLMFAFLPALAGHYDAAYYKRTATKPPVEVEGFFAGSVRYVDGMGGGIGGGLQFKESGVMLLLQATYDERGGVNGTTPFSVGCRDYAVPYSTGNQGHRGVEFTFAIPFRKASAAH